MAELQRFNQLVKNPNNSHLEEKSGLKGLIIISFVIVVSMIFLGVITYSFTEKEVVKKLIDKELLNIADSIATKIDSRMERAIETSLLLARDPVVIEWVAGKEEDLFLQDYALEKLQVLTTRFQYNNAFIVSSLTNHYWAETGEIIQTISKNEPGDKWFFEALEANKPVVVNIDYNKMREGMFVFLNTPMQNEGTPIAIVGVGLSLTDLAEEFQLFTYGEESRIWLMGNDGSIFISNELDQLGLHAGEFLPENLVKQIVSTSNHNDGSPRYFNYQDEKGKQVDVVLSRVNSADWNLLLHIPRSETVAFLDKIKTATAATVIILIISATGLIIFIFRNVIIPYRRALESNNRLEQHIIEYTDELYEKNKMLMDSLDYAKRIQEAILPSPEVMETMFEDYFVLWKPKVVVSGDFYWVKQGEQGYLVAVGDCTGHGVPGALMTTVTSSILNLLDKEDSIRNPGYILSALNNFIKKTLKQDQENTITDDGLDLGLCYISGRKLIFAGAKMALYINKGNSLQTIKGNNKSIGYRRTAGEYQFDNTIVEIGENDIFYLTTDGLLDQNGSRDEYLSFGRKGFEELILSYGHLPMHEQQEKFMTAIELFMGEETQRDDIVVLGFKPR